MAATKYYFEGECQWAKVFKPDTHFEPHAYKIDMFLDKAGFEVHKASGLKNKPKFTEDGKKFVTFNNKVGKWPSGDPIAAPEVLDKDGNKFEKLIGNGSKVAIEVDVYDAGQFGKGHRFTKVVVVDHVPYEKEAEAAEESKEPGKAKPKGLPF